MFDDALESKSSRGDGARGKMVTDASGRRIWPIEIGYFYA